MNTIGSKLISLTLAAIILFHLIGNLIWLREGACLYGKDVAGHLKLTTKIYCQLQAIAQSRQPVPAKLISLPGLLQEPASPFAEGTWVWPKLLHLYAAAVCVVVGLSDLAMILSNILWLAVALVSVTYLGTKMVDRRTGLLAALLLSLYPGVYGLSRQYGTDYPLIAAVAASMAILVSSDFFKRRVVLLGVVMGLGVLIKAQLFFFILCPFLYCLAAGIAAGRRSGRRAFGTAAGAFAAMGVAAFVSSIWWFPIAGRLSKSFVSLTAEDSGFLFSHSFRPFTPAWMFFYVRATAINISVLFSVFLIASIPLFASSKARLKGLVAVWPVGAYVIYTIIKAKTPSYFFPAFPALALITAAGLLNIGRRRMRSFLILVLIIGGVAQFFVLSFMRTGFNPVPVEGLSYNTEIGSYCFPPFENNYKEVAGAVAQKLHGRTPNLKNMRVGLVELSGGLWQQNFSDIFEYYMRFHDRDFYLYRSHFNRTAFLRYAPAFNYILVMGHEGGDLRDDLLRLERAYPPCLVDAAFGDREALRKVAEGYGDYELIGEWNLMPGHLRLALLASPPISLAAGVEIPAVKFFRSNMYCRFPLAGTSRALAAEKTEQDYDMFFPLEKQGPVAARRYAEYYLRSEEDREASFSIQYASEKPIEVDIYLDGEPIAKNVTPEDIIEAVDSGFRWGKLSNIGIKAGDHILRIETRNLPTFQALRME